MCIINQIVFSGDKTKVYFWVDHNTKCIFDRFVFSSENTKLYLRVSNNTKVYLRAILQKRIKNVNIIVF